ncbi:class II histone deacetylase [Conexibacter arvalis]|uniref:Acetoin utilization deacetylase AcuC-like enzyme n=1 Tax=Conexibacter arvalis TaxID=912552 RepID=A0A840IC98_9ACTN|nr:class II histone deacetylase [Conexibacter arvalis]MBB4661861.1 acetoin utilization deacetylase AcuC-like enzyme [Conexibacter arvalis]
MQTGFVWHERYMWHNTGRASGPFLSDASGWLEPDWRHTENSDTKRRLRNLLDVSGLLDRLVRIDPRPATVEELCRFHAPEYVERVRELSAGAGGEGVDGTTVIGKGSYEVALLAAGGVIAAVDAVLDGTVDNAYALVRPAGHHALADAAMGFCLFGNVAVAAHHARVARGLERVAVVDWDVHHGNGTQAAFYDDPSVLTISLHQDNCFPPGSGLVEETGAGAGEGFNINVPLPPGSGDGAYEAAFERIVVPALERFEPQLILVASGLDASAMDPLGRMMLSPRGYGRIAEQLLDAAARLCDGRVAMAHEGGYSAELVPFCGLAVIERMAGVETKVRGTILQEFPAGMGQQQLQPHEAALIDRVAEAAGLAERAVG